MQAFSFLSKIIFLSKSVKEENIVWLKKKLNYLTENLNKLNAIGWSIKEKKNEEKLEEIANDFEGKGKCEIGLKNIVRYRHGETEGYSKDR